jgi:phage head maturation protease
MKITTPFTITAADSESRTITGKIVEFDVPANASTGKVMFKRGSLNPSPVKLNLEHDSGRPIGKSLSMELSPDGNSIVASFKISKTTAGSDAIQEAMDGLRDGFSVEANVNDHGFNEDGTMIVNSADLVGVALTHNPAFGNARVSDVAAQEVSETPEVSEDNPTEGDAVENTTVEEAPTEETPAVEASHKITANTTPMFTTRPRLDFSPGKYVENHVRAALGNEQARMYVAAAADTTDNAGLIPTRQFNEIINGLANGTRSNVDAISRGVLPDAGMTFEIPKISQLPSVATVSEAGTFSETDQNSAFISIPVLKAAGQQTFSVELLDRSSPLFYNELLSNMAAQMAKVQDTAVNAALYDGSTTDATTTVTYPTAAELLGVISRGAASVYNGTQRFAKNIIMNTAQWSNVMTLNNNGAPLYNVGAGTNNFTGGVVTPTSIRGNIAGLDLYVTANTAQGTDTDGSIIIVDPSAYTFYETGNYTLRADVVASGQISVGVYAYYAIATKLAAGAFKNNKA